jgi:hypothetical protein
MVVQLGMDSGNSAIIALGASGNCTVVQVAIALWTQLYRPYFYGVESPRELSSQGIIATRNRGQTPITKILYSVMTHRPICSSPKF